MTKPEVASRPLVLRLRQAAELSGVGEKVLREACRTGSLRHWATEGGHVRVPLAALEEWIDAQCEQTEAERAARTRAWRS